MPSAALAESFYAETTQEINTFTGVADATMYRDEGWHFMRLGWFIERTQLLVALLLAQFAASRPQGETADTDWTSLLRSCQAFYAYKRSYSIEIQPDRVIEVLVTDPLLPSSLCCALDVLAAELAAISESPDSHAGAAAERLAGRLCTLIRYEWPDREDREALLAQVGEECRKLHTLVSQALHDCLQYIPGSTTAESPVEHILKTGRGVCQDYAHLMLAIARSWGIPARYVSGYLNPGEQASSNATHAWVECRLPELGWVGFDPTNQSLAGAGGKVHIAVGRDYRDVVATTARPALPAISSEATADAPKRIASYT